MVPSFVAAPLLGCISLLQNYHHLSRISHNIHNAYEASFICNNSLSAPSLLLKLSLSNKITVDKAIHRADHFSNLFILIKTPCLVCWLVGGVYSSMFWGEWFAWFWMCGQYNLIHWFQSRIESVCNRLHGDVYLRKHDKCERKLTSIQKRICLQHSLICVLMTLWHL